MTDAEFAPHLNALRRCVEDGFRFRAITDGLHGLMKKRLPFSNRAYQTSRFRPVFSGCCLD
jgi:hypothetical protein